MDDQPAAPPRARFGPDLRFTWAAGAGAVIAALVAAVTGDPEGRLLAVLVALVLAAYAVGDLAFRPRLEVDADAVTVRAPLTRAVLPWAQVESIRAESRMRFGMRSTTLEVDAGAVLAVLSRRALAADPAEVADIANAFRPGGPPS